MIWAILTALCWTAAGYGSARSARALGSGRANRWRLAIGIVLLYAIHVSISGWSIVLPGVVWFCLGGFFHLGWGDTALYGGYRVLGPRLGGLVCLCLSVPMAGVIEWLWLGQEITLLRIGLMAGIIASVLAAMAPTERIRLGAGAIKVGLMCGALAGLGQALGAVATRQGFAISEAAAVAIHPLTGAFYRCLGGMVFLALVIGLSRLIPTGDVGDNYSRSTSKAEAQSQQRVWPWVLLSTFMGPVVGIATLHAALEVMPAAEVQAVLACLPLCMVPVAWLMDGDKPSLRSVIAGAFAIAGVVAMALTA